MKITKINPTQTAKNKIHKIRVAAYCRVSTDSDEQHESLETQRAHYENVIASNHNWVFVGVYYDDGISGTSKDKRPALKRLIKDCEDRKIDLVVTKSISRFARNTSDCLELVRKLLDLNISVRFEKENIDTGIMENELMISVLSSTAESESASMSQNIKWAIQKRFQNGTFKNSTAPYGYILSNGQLEVNKDEAEVVRQIFSSYLNGKGVNLIADELNSKAIQSRKNLKWSPTTINAMLVNEKYTGAAEFQKNYTDSQYVRHINHGEKNKYFIQKYHTPIISENDFRTVGKLMYQHSLEKNIEKGSKKYINRYPFSGRLICGECGASFKRRIHKGKTNSYAAWCCNTHLKDKSSCSMLFVKNKVIEQAFVSMLNKLLFANREILVPVRKYLRTNARDDGRRRIHELENELIKIEEREIKLQQLMAHNYLERTYFIEQQNKLKIHAAECRAEINDLKSVAGGESELLVELNRLIGILDSHDEITEFDGDIFEKLVKKVIIYSRTEFGFVLKCGLTFREVI